MRVSSDNGSPITLDGRKTVMKFSWTKLQVRLTTGSMVTCMVPLLNFDQCPSADKLSKKSHLRSRSILGLCGHIPAVSQPQTIDYAVSPHVHTPVRRLRESTTKTVPKFLGA